MCEKCIVVRVLSIWNFWFMSIDLEMDSEAFLVFRFFFGGGYAKLRMFGIDYVVLKFN